MQNDHNFLPPRAVPHRNAEMQPKMIENDQITSSRLVPPFIILRLGYDCDQTNVKSNISRYKHFLTFRNRERSSRNAQQGEPEHRELRAKDDHMMQDSPAALHRTRAWHGG